jgi:hypothetical protein
MIVSGTVFFSFRKQGPISCSLKSLNPIHPKARNKIKELMLEVAANRNTDKMIAEFARDQSSYEPSGVTNR